jgi:hypothetical protein
MLARRTEGRGLHTVMPREVRSGTGALMEPWFHEDWGRTFLPQTPVPELIIWHATRALLGQ